MSRLFFRGKRRASEDDSARNRDEGPQHQVTLTCALLMQITPVTQAQWEALMGNNPSEFKGADLPVDNVSWFDAVAYCNRLSQKSGIEEAYVLSNVSGKPGERINSVSTHPELLSHFKATVHWKGLACPGFRLPTEAEWEHACRAGTDGRIFGDTATAWYDVNSGGTTHPVGKKKPNAFGLYDMIGNVWEWCWDCHGGYQQDSVTDPVGPGYGEDRVTRGGTYCSSAIRTRFGPGQARASARNDSRPESVSDTKGFRPTRSLA